MHTVPVHLATVCHGRYSIEQGPIIDAFDPWEAEGNAYNHWASPGLSRGGEHAHYL